MSVRQQGAVLHLEGDCPVEDAEALMALLLAMTERQVDLAAAGALHTAVVQVLVALRPRLLNQPADPFLRAWLLPALLRAGAHQSVTT